MNKYVKLISDLKALHVQFDKGLSDKEIEHIEITYGVHFPKSLREMYQIELPVSGSFKEG